MNPNSDPNRSISSELWDAFREKSRLACARLMTLIDNDPSLIPVVRDKLIPMQHQAIRIGITGPPGVGKSTVTSALTRCARQHDLSVGVIAVDPSSPFTGGAFLGDRVRMQEHVGDAKVFIRSLASRKGSGGLSPSTPYVADILDAFGMDWILIETVGVGQAELDILTCSDLIILVMQPGTGDVIQTMKAGIMETADLFVVNKADLPGSASLVDAIRFLFEVKQHHVSESIPPILTTSAIQGIGMEAVFNAMTQAIERFVVSGGFERKRQLRLENEIQSMVMDNLWRRFSQMTNAPNKIKTAACQLARQNGSPYPFIQALGREVDLLPHLPCQNEHDPGT